MRLSVGLLPFPFPWLSCCLIQERTSIVAVVETVDERTIPSNVSQSGRVALGCACTLSRWTELVNIHHQWLFMDTEVLPSPT